jgi:CRP-like cAMP-binding protein
VLLKAQLRTEHRSKYLFLAGLPIFQHLRSFVVESLALLFEEEELRYGQVLFHQGEQLKYIFLVFSGEFRLLRSVNRHSVEGVKRKSK